MLMLELRRFVVEERDSRNVTSNTGSKLRSSFCEKGKEQKKKRRRRKAQTAGAGLRKN
jgi:hypothetical protein